MEGRHLHASASVDGRGERTMKPASTLLLALTGIRMRVSLEAEDFWSTEIRS